MRVIDVISICRFVQFSHGPMAHPHPHQLLLLLSYSQLSRIHQPDLLPPARTHRTHRTHEISLFWKSSCSEYFSLFRTFLESRLKQPRREALRIDLQKKLLFKQGQKGEIIFGVRFITIYNIVEKSIHCCITDQSQSRQC